MATVQLSLAVIAFVLTLINGINNKVPLWIPVLLICILLMIPALPVKY